MSFMESLFTLLWGGALSGLVVLSMTRAIGWPAWPSITAVGFAVLWTSESIYVATVLAIALSIASFFFRTGWYQVIAVLSMAAVVVVLALGDVMRSSGLWGGVPIALMVGLACGSFVGHARLWSRLMLAMCIVTVLTAAIMLAYFPFSYSYPPSYVSAALTLCMFAIGLQLASAVNAGLERTRLKRERALVHSEIDALIDRIGRGAAA